MKKEIICNMYNMYIIYVSVGGGQNLKRRNVERPVFQNFETANMKIKKDELFDNSTFELLFSFL